MSVIVFEGADGSGKTHTTKRLLSGLGFVRLATCGRPTSRQDIENTLMDFEEMIESKEVYLTDRAPFISEFIYARAFDNPLLTSAERLLEFWDMIDDVVYCRPLKPSIKNISREFKEHKPPEFTDQVIARHARIQTYYDDLFNREDLPFTVTRLDSWSDEQYLNLANYIRTKYYV